MVALAVIGAAASVLGGIIGGKGAKKAARIAQQTAREQIAAQIANREYQYSLNAPAIEHGGAADNTIAGLLNIGGDPAASESAFHTFQDHSGFKEMLKQGVGAVNSNAFARKMGDSGATYKALQERGEQIGNASIGDYISRLGGVSAGGTNARGLVAGIGQNTVNAQNQSQQFAGETSANAALFKAGNLSKTIQDLVNLGANQFGSSYKLPEYKKIS
jgi:hypothetical protein